MPVKRTVVLPVLRIVSLGVLASGYSGRTVEVARAHALTGHSAVIARTGFVARAAEGSAAPNRRGVGYLPTRVGFAHAVGMIAATSPDLTHSVPWRKLRLTPYAPGRSERLSQATRLEQSDGTSNPTYSCIGAAESASKQTLRSTLVRHLRVRGQIAPSSSEPHTGNQQGTQHKHGDGSGAADQQSRLLAASARRVRRG